MTRTRKRPKTGAKAVSRACRNNGICDRCNKGRQHATTKRLEAIESDLRDLRRKVEGWDFL